MKNLWIVSAVLRAAAFIHSFRRRASDSVPSRAMAQVFIANTFYRFIPLRGSSYLAINKLIYIKTK
jgi:hypothetical protein